MQLRDLLKSEDFKKLNSLRGKNKNNKKSSKKNKMSNKKQNKNSNKEAETKVKKDRVSYFENKVEKNERKLNYMKECTYCGREDLIITASGYYECEFCGIRVGKR